MRDSEERTKRVDKWAKLGTRWQLTAWCMQMLAENAAKGTNWQLAVKVPSQQERAVALGGLEGSAIRPIGFFRFDGNQLSTRADQQQYFRRRFTESLVVGGADCKAKQSKSWQTEGIEADELTQTRCVQS
jgi:hypothetical protein